MNNSIEKFEDYLRGEMSQAELASFEIELSLNPELEASFTEYQMIRESVSSRMKSQKGEMELKGSLTKLGDQYFQEQEVVKHKPRMISFRMLRFAALFVFFLCATGLIYNQFIRGPLTPSALADKYYVHSTLSQVRSQSNTASDIKELYDAHNNGDHDLVDQLLVTADPSNLNTQAIIASQYYHKKEYEKSYAAWKNIADLGKGEFEDRAMWYMALAQLKLNNTSLAREYLEFFRNDSNSIFKEGALEILRDLDRSK